MTRMIFGGIFIIFVDEKKFVGIVNISDDRIFIIF